MSVPGVSLGKPIGLGRTAEIYAWEEGWVLKLFHDWFPAESVEYEAGIARAVHAAGLPVPAVGDVVDWDGRLGLVYERVDGPTMLEELSRKPWTLRESARLLAGLQAAMHGAGVAVALPSQHRRLEEKIRRARGLGPALRAHALGGLEAMPGGERLCHGDFHPGNVIMTGQGPVVIDWNDATVGSPMGDVARSSVILLGARKQRDVSWLQRAMLGWYHGCYVRRYFELRPGGEEEYRAWIPVVAAARMSEGIDEIEGWLRGRAEAGLAMGSEPLILT